MKTTLRIFRIISKLLLLAYVTIVNFVFIAVFLCIATFNLAPYMAGIYTGAV